MDIFNTTEIIALFGFVFAVVAIIAAITIGGSHKKGRMQDLANSGGFWVFAIVLFGFGMTAMANPELIANLGVRLIETIVNLGA